MSITEWFVVAFLLLVTDQPQSVMPGAEPTLGTGTFEKPPATIKELIEQQLGPIKKPPFIIRRCKWPCERSA